MLKTARKTRKALQTATLLAASWMPLSVHAVFDTETKESDPSFYGARSIIPNQQSITGSDIQFQRRAIAPVMTNEEEASKNEAAPLVLITPSRTELTTSPLSAVTLSRNDKLLAKKAYYYFEQNWNDKTGLFNSVQGYHHTTMWDVASGIAAILSAEGLALITTEQANDKLAKTLDALLTLPLYQQSLPNREYSTRSAKPSGRFSTHRSNGNGWSALDIGRLLIWLEILQTHKPELRPAIQHIVDKWQLEKAVFQGTLYGELKTGQNSHYRQEGRLGYLQYAAYGYKLFGFDVSAAYKQQDIAQVTVEGIPLLVDQRNLAYFTTDPYVLLGIEIGSQNQWWNQLNALFELHKLKSAKEASYWVFAEDAMSRSPWFSYNNMYIYGKAWVSIAPGGQPIENPQIFSNKAAFALSVLFDGDDFGYELAEQVVANSLPHRAIPTGVYLNGGPNSAYNINTNSLILSALWYKKRHFTPLIKPSSAAL
ncbi:DUF3131 domain-containing protein [Photobacterium sp. DA100]|uniref:DUF3131 domain-containing protein n=1 Tax=Photobacterium sp. DA100 TaxID=3027472 RepID=UPI0024785B79|nr:DUF3131 domain-containing protein [Photobacterium sp. DA100]WEM43534.1 DUF3131 domain-containing protein [Photobacterium sp. DA100]